MPTHHIQMTFAGGEFAPSLYARIDLQKYASGLKTARNIFVHPHGGASNRPGTKYVAAVKDSSKKTRVIPFEFSTDQAYVIEIGAGYFRFYMDRGAIAATAANGIPTYGAGTAYNVDDWVISSSVAYRCIQAGTGHTPASSPTYWTAGTIYEISNPYSEADLASVKFTQSADILYLFHPDHAIQKLTRTDHAQWTLTTLDFKNGPFMPSNVTAANTMTVSDVTGTGKTLTSSVNIFDADHVGALFKTVHQIPAQSVVVDFNGTGASASSIKCGGTWRIMSHGTWTGTVKIEKSIDGGSNWTELRSFTSKDNFNINTYGEDEEYCLIRLNCTSFMATPSGTAAWSNTTAYTADTYCTYGGVLYRAIAATAVDGSGVVTIANQPDISPGYWQPKTCKVELASDPFEQTGIVKVTAITSAKVATVSILKEVGATTATSDWAEGSWSAYRGFPCCGLFFQDRFAAAGTYTEPQTIWFSMTGSYEDFGRSEPLVDTDGISVNLPSRKMNGINNLVALGEIIAFTSSSEWTVGPGDSGILTPTSIETRLQGNRGSSAVDPVAIGSRVLFCQPMDSVVCDLGYEYAASGYTSQELSIISNHLFQGYTIKEIAFQQEPDSVVWFVRDDGSLLALTYMREQEVIAWTRHDTGEVVDASGNSTFDSFESVCSIPGDGYNEVWFVVKRGSNRYVEYFVHRDTTQPVEDQYFVDCGITYDSTPASYISNLTWLQGKTVSILADGNVSTDTVANPTAWNNSTVYAVDDYVSYSGTNYRAILPGANHTPSSSPTYWTASTPFVHVTPAASVIHIGLPYVSDLETLNVELPQQDGTSQDQTMQVGQVTLRFDKSRGGWVGSDVAHLDQVIQRTTEDYDDPIQLFTGDYQTPINGSYDAKGKVFFRQVDPLPVTVLAVMPQITMGG